MTRDDYQSRISGVNWYHEFNFPNGLVARSRTADVEYHRKIWNFITLQLDKIDIAGKTVLDLGCWDGYWSFYAERRGAKHVLATDDATQNWAESSGVLLAKELLNSSVEVQLDVSVYNLTQLRRTFDVVFCLGIYYHLVDPFYAFSQIRHCCHPGTLVVFEGDCTYSLTNTSIHYDLTAPSMPLFVPSPQALAQMFEANYFRVISQTGMVAESPPLPPPPKKTRLLRRIFPKPASTDTAPQIDAFRSLDRLVTVCQPVETNNKLHHYRPPFGLHRYDERFRDK